MPKIPQMGEARGRSLDVPRMPTPSGEGVQAIARGKQAIAGGLSDIAVAYGQLEKKRTLMKRNQFEKESDALVDAKVMDIETKNETIYGGTDFEGSTDFAINDINELMEEQLEKAPDEQSREDVRLSFENRKTRLTAGFLSREHKGAAKYNKDQFFAGIEKNRSLIFESADFDMANRKLQEGMKDLQKEVGITLSADEAAKTAKEGYKYAIDGLEGGLKNGGADLLRAEKFLNGEDSNENLLATLSPEQKTRYSKRIETAKKVEANEVTTAISSGISRASKMVRSGAMDFATPGHKERILAPIIEGLSSKDPKLVEKADMANAEFMLSKTETNIARTGVADLDLEGHPELIGEDTKLLHKTMASKLEAKVRQKIATDGATYLYQKDPTARLLASQIKDNDSYEKYKDYMRSKFILHKVTSGQKYIPPNIKQGFISKFKQGKQQKDPKIIADVMGQLDNIFGDDSHSAMMELGIDEAFGTLSTVAPDDRAMIAGIILNPITDKNAVITQKHQTALDKESGLFDSVARAGGFKNSAEAKANAHVIRKQAVALMYANEDMTAKEAVKTFSHRFKPYNGEKGDVVIDEQAAGVPAKEIETAIESFFETEDIVGKYNVDVGGAVGRLEGLKEYVPDVLRKAVYGDTQEEIEDHAEFISTSDFKGVMLFNKSTNQPYTDKTTGKAITFSYEDLLNMQNTTKKSDRAVEKAKKRDQVVKNKELAKFLRNKTDISLLSELSE